MFVVSKMNFDPPNHQPIKSSAPLPCGRERTVELTAAERLQYLKTVAVRHVVAAFMHCTRHTSEQLH